MISSDEENAALRGGSRHEKRDAPSSDLSARGVNVIYPRPTIMHPSNTPPVKLVDGFLLLQAVSGVDLGPLSAAARQQIVRLWRDGDIAKKRSPPNLHSLFANTGLSREDLVKVVN